MYYKKKYSQIFLKNKDKILKIIKIILTNKIKYNYLLEIGPGLGILTNSLIKKIKKKIFLIEIDKRFCIFLKKNNNNNNVKIINCDILNIKLKKIKKNKKFYIIGNFPYNISSKLIIWLIKNKKYISKCTGMFQKEFINNLFYKNKKYNSRLSLIFNMFFNINKKLHIPKENFYPIPKVDSILVDIIPNKKKYSIDIRKFEFFIKEIYKFKRKIVKNSFKLIFKKKYNYNKLLFYKRPEDLTISEYLILYNIYENK